MGHDDRCEAGWNDGVCSCSERAENRAHGFWAEHPERTARSVIRNFLRRTS